MNKPDESRPWVGGNSVILLKKTSIFEICPKKYQTTKQPLQFLAFIKQNTYILRFAKKEEEMAACKQNRLLENTSRMW